MEEMEDLEFSSGVLRLFVFGGIGGEYKLFYNCSKKIGLEVSVQVVDAIYAQVSHPYLLWMLSIIVVDRL